MISQIMTNEAVTVITSDGIKFPQTSKPQPTHQSPGSLKKSLKAEVKVMATIQIMCGVMVFCLGTILASVVIIPHFTSVYSVLLKSTYPFLGALCFIISGILSVITDTKSTKSLVHGSLALSILSIPCALMGIIILSINLSNLDDALQQCELSRLSRPTEYMYRSYIGPQDIDCFHAKAVLTGALSVMLICSVVELGLAVLTAVLWWKQAHSNCSGNVIFLSQDSRNKSSMLSKAHSTSAYEGLLTP